MEFAEGKRIIFTGGWGQSEFRLPGVLKELSAEPCRHPNCSMEFVHIVWVARLDTGAWVIGYPEQFGEEPA